MPTLTASSPFDLIGGLPVHALVVHAAVVLLPLSAIALVVAIVVPRTRRILGPTAVVGLGISTLAAFVARQSGEDLAARIGEPADHARLGGILPFVALVAFGLGLAWLLSQRRPGSRGLGGVLAGTAALVSVAALVLTVVVGHTGATAVWADALPAEAPAITATAATEALAGTVPQTRSATGAKSAPARAKPITAAQVATHASRASCWASINGSVYDLTNWINRHPGGPRRILAICGRDGSAAFNGQHAGSAKAAADLRQFRIGALSPR